MRKMSQIIPIVSLCLVVPLISSAQIPNAGFESWTAGSPTGWNTNNVPPLLTPFTQSSDAHSGTSSMQGSTISYLSVSVPPAAYIDFSVNARYSSLKGWYKFTPLGGDTLRIHAVFFKGKDGVGYTVFSTGATTSTYTQFTSPITYISPAVPDTAYLEMSIESPGDNYHVGSTFKIDDLAFGAATNVQESFSTSPTVFALSQNYPNPFNPSTKITYQLPADGMVHLKVYDLMGRVAGILVNGEKPAGQFTATFDGTKFTSGVYFYRLDVHARNGKSFSQTNKMVLMK